MTLDQLVGAVVVRTASVQRDYVAAIISSSSRGFMDASYTRNPIKVEAIENGIIFYRAEPKGKIQILGPEYKDSNWAKIPDSLLDELWSTKETL